MCERTSYLERLAKKYFDDLYPSEKNLIRYVTIGEPADYNSNDPEVCDLDNYQCWDASRILRAEFVTWLCVDSEVTSLISHKGVRIKGARITGQIDLENAVLQFPLVLETCVMLDVPREEECAIVLRDAVVPKLSLAGSHTGPIDATGLHTKSSLCLCNGFHAKGEINLLNARIEGDLDCRKGKFENPHGKNAILADRMTVYGRVLMCEGFEAIGRVRLCATDIGWMLDCSDGTFKNDNGLALLAAGIETKNGSIWLARAKCSGSVHLGKARIRYDLCCRDAELSNPEGKALNLKGMALEGSVFLNANKGGKFSAEGEVTLERASIGGNLDCRGARFSNSGSTALNAKYTRIKGGLILSAMQTKPQGGLDLGRAEAGHLAYDANSWPVKDKPEGDEPERDRLVLDGFVYGHIVDDAPGDAQVGYDWLHWQREGPFRPQPYEQLAAVLRRTGHDEDARKILIQKNKDRAKFDKLTPFAGFGHSILGATIDYGYRPQKALLWILAMVLFGWIIFYIGFEAGAMRSPVEEGYTGTPNSLVYSIDTFVPLLDLRQGNYWLPDSEFTGELKMKDFGLPVSGYALRIYLWFHIVLGWILTTLFVAGMTGLVRR